MCVGMERGGGGGRDEVVGGRRDVWRGRRWATGGVYGVKAQLELIMTSQLGLMSMFHIRYIHVSCTENTHTHTHTHTYIHTHPTLGAINPCAGMVVMPSSDSLTSSSVDLPPLLLSPSPSSLLSLSLT